MDGQAREWIVIANPPPPETRTHAPTGKGKAREGKEKLT